ncbi:MAG: porin [Phenylobacterium sp.]|nr:MAG: porin [Phenylobacterium sp.]
MQNGFISKGWAMAGKRLLMMTASLALMASAAQAATDPRDDEIAALKAQLQIQAQTLKALQDRVEGLENRPAVAAAPAVQTIPVPPPAPPSAGGASIAGGHPSIQSADGRFIANLHAVMQFDAAQYYQRDPGPLTSDFRRGAASTDTAHARDLSSGSDFRRARIGIDGKVFGDFEYNALFDFGGAGEEDAGHIQELWLQYSGLRPFHFKIGAYPPSIGLEDQASTNGAPFLERPAVADMARSVAGGDFRESAEIWAGGDRWYANAAMTGRLVGVVNSTATGVSQPFDSQLAWIGRVAFLPALGEDYLVHIGAHGSYVEHPADAGGPDTAPTAARYTITIQERPELRVDGTRLISTGAIDAAHASTMGVEAAAQWRTLWIESEYEHFDIDRRNAAVGQTDPSFNGFYVEGSWIVTGERRRYNANTAAFDAPPVDHPFSVENGTWGAWEVALRYSDIDLNYNPGAAGTAPTADAVRGGEQKITTFGVNWYMNSVIRFMVEYQDVRVDRLSPSATTFQTPAGAQVGQHYNALALRSQMAF